MYVPLLNAFILSPLHASKSLSPNATSINHFNPPTCTFNAPDNDIKPPFGVVDAFDYFYTDIVADGANAIN